MKLSAAFFISLSFYVALQIVQEIAPLLIITELIVPIFILTLLRGKELGVFIVIQCLFLARATITFLPFLGEVGEFTYYIVKIASTTAPKISIAQVQQFVLVGYLIMPFASLALNYIIAERMIRKKKIRERVAKCYPN